MDKVPCSKTQHLVLSGTELLTPNLDLEALPFHTAPYKVRLVAKMISSISVSVNVHPNNIKAAHERIWRKQYNLVCSLLYRCYAFGRTKSREICQNVFLCYDDNVWRFIYTFIYIQVNCEPCYLSEGLR